MTNDFFLSNINDILKIIDTNEKDIKQTICIYKLKNIMIKKHMSRVIDKIKKKNNNSSIQIIKKKCLRFAKKNLFNKDEINELLNQLDNGKIDYSYYPHSIFSNYFISLIYENINTTYINKLKINDNQCDNKEDLIQIIKSLKEIHKSKSEIILHNNENIEI